MPESVDARRERARLAALTRWAKTPPADRSRNARKAYRRRFENQVDPERLLSSADRAKLVDTAIAAEMSKLTYNRMRKRGERR
jgi:hypothetical protein